MHKNGRPHTMGNNLLWAVFHQWFDVQAKCIHNQIIQVVHNITAIFGMVSLVHRIMGVWRAMPHWLMWCLWREYNGRSFDDCEKTIVELKLLFFRTLFEWVSVRGSISCVSLHQFLDFCSLWAWFVCDPSILVYWGVFFNYQKSTAIFLINSF